MLEKNFPLIPAETPTGFPLERKVITSVAAVLAAFPCSMMSFVVLEYGLSTKKLRVNKG